MPRAPARSRSGPDPSHRIVVLHGKDAFLQAQLTADLREALRREHGEIDTLQFDGTVTPVADVLDECRTLGLMQQHKLVIVDNADRFLSGKKGGEDEDGEAEEEAPGRPGQASRRELVERYAGAPNEAATLVLRAGKWNKGKLDALVEKVGARVECEPLRPGEAERWAIDRAAGAHGAVLEPAGAELLAERVGADRGRLDSELAKLAVLAPGKPARITRQAVAALVGLTREEEAWGVQEAILAGSPTGALDHLRVILDNAPREAAIPVSWMMMDLARKLHGTACGLEQGMNVWALAGRLKLWPESRRDAIAEAARELGTRRAADLLRAAVEADRAMKSGLGRADRTLEVLALRFLGV